jgi:hypothetical protein
VNARKTLANDAREVRAAQANENRLLRETVTMLINDNRLAREATTSDARDAREHMTDMLLQYTTRPLDEVQNTTRSLDESTNLPTHPNTDNVPANAETIIKFVDDTEYEFFKSEILQSINAHELQDSINATSLVLDAITRHSDDGADATYPFGLSQHDVQSLNDRELIALMDTAFKNSEDDIIDLNTESFRAATMASPRTYDALKTAWEHLKHIMTRASKLDKYGYGYLHVLGSTNAIFNNYLLNINDPQVSARVHTRMRSLGQLHFQNHTAQERHTTAVTLITTYATTLLQIIRPITPITTYSIRQTHRHPARPYTSINLVARGLIQTSTPSTDERDEESETSTDAAATLTQDTNSRPTRNTRSREQSATTSATAPNARVRKCSL